MVLMSNHLRDPRGKYAIYVLRAMARLDLCVIKEMLDFWRNRLWLVLVKQERAWVIQAFRATWDDQPMPRLNLQDTCVGVHCQPPEENCIEVLVEPLRFLLFFVQAAGARSSLLFSFLWFSLIVIPLWKVTFEFTLFPYCHPAMPHFFGTFCPLQFGGPLSAPSSFWAFSLACFYCWTVRSIPRVCLVPFHTPIFLHCTSSSQGTMAGDVG